MMQKALDNILQHYLRQETLVSGEDGGVDEELLQSLHKCLEEKGVLKEVHAFLRKRLVAVLQGTWPQLFDHFRTDADLSLTVLKLVEDFLCSHKLLFTLSILSTELGETYSPKVGFGKFSSADAEKFLDKLGIPSNSVQSHAILENYSRVGCSSSLLESIVNYSPTGVSLLLRNHQMDNDNGEISFQKTKNFVTLDERLKKIDEKYLRHQEKKHNNLRREESLSVDQRFRHLALDLERDKQIQLQIAIDKFKTEEISRIKDEIETSQKFELLRKEKELLANYEEKVNHMKNNLEREKELWLVEKMQKEREIFERREELLLTIQSVRETVREDKVTESTTQTVERSEEFQRQSFGDRNPIQDNFMEPSALLFDKTPAQKEMERAYLLKEAKLRTVIEKLQKENDQLKSAPPSLLIMPKRRSKFEDAEVSTSEDSRRQRHHTASSPPRSSRKVSIPDRSKKMRWKQEYADGQNSIHDQRFVPVPLSGRDTDAVAFLQYQLECQSDEIEKLRSVMQMRVSAEVSPPPRKVTFTTDPPLGNGGAQPRKPTSPIVIPKSLEATAVDDFLREAKKRISDIEQEAHQVEETLTRMHSSGDKVSSAFPEAGKRPEKQAHPTLPCPPAFPKSLFERLNSLRQLTTIPNYLTSGVRNPVISIPPMETTHASFLTDYRKNRDNDHGPQRSACQQQLGRKGPLQFPVGRQQFLAPTATLRNPDAHTGTAGDLERRPAADVQTSEKSTSLSGAPLPPETKAELRNTGRRVNEVAEDPRLNSQSEASSASSVMKRSRKGNRSQENGSDESLQHPGPKNANNGRIELEKGNGELSIQGSSNSMKEKASRSGALVKNKVERRGDNPGDEDEGRGGGDTSSSIATLKSSPVASLAYNNKSLEKVLKPPAQNLSLLSPGERLGPDSCPNPINVTSDDSGPSTSPFHALTPVVTAKRLEEDLDDLGNFETSKDTLDIDDDDLFWQM